MKLISFTTLLILFTSLTAMAQLRETIHQTFDIDEASTVSIHLTGEYEIVKWAGNTIMSHTYIELSDAKPSILKYYVGAGRYEIAGKSNGDQYSINAKDAVRRPIRFKDLECFEHTMVKLFVPDNFDIIDDHKLVRQEETSSATTNQE